MVLDTFSIPIGKTTLLLSSNVKTIEIVSFCNISDGKYKKAGFTGRIAYENAYELDSDSYSQDNVLDDSSSGNTVQLPNQISFNKKKYMKSFIAHTLN